MADQVLRPMAEVVLWADLPVLQQLWSSFLPVVDSLPCWVCTSSLLLVLQRTVQLRQLPPLLLGPASRNAVRALTARVSALLPGVVQQVAHLVDAAASDKVFVLSVHLLVCLLARFRHELKLMREEQARAAARPCIHRSSSPTS